MNKKQEKYLKRTYITGIVCIIYALVVLIINLIQKVKWYEYIAVVTLFIAGIVFVYTSNKVKIKKQNINKVKK